MAAPKASLTAEFIAAARAVETIRPARTRLFSDPYARAFLTHPMTRSIFRLAASLVGPDVGNRLYDRASGVIGLMTSFVCRTRCIDDALGRGLAAGCEQVLILGAGYDCRAYRIAGIDKVSVFDIDHAAIQACKRERLRAAVDPAPPHVTFVATDFGHDDLPERLGAAGFRIGAPTFVVWEGVSQYLDADGVDRLLLTLVALCAPGSPMAFTYVDAGVFDHDERFPGVRRLLDRVQRSGEPWRFGLKPADLGAFLDARGHSLVEDSAASRLAADYLGPIGRVGPVSDFTHIATSRIAGS